jgi:hypothetical protein
MNQRINFFIYEYKYSAAVTFLAAASLLTLGYASCGLFDTSILPNGFTTRTELVGLVLMLIIMPSYLASGLILGQRRSLQLAQESDTTGGHQFAERIIAMPTSYLVTGSILGFAYSFLNMPNEAFAAFILADISLMAITVGQIIVWTTTGLVLASRYHTSRAFYSAGKHVHLDIFETSNLAPFGKAGLTDALLVVVALAITSLQSLDAQFRLYNYVTAFAIVIPAIIVLMVMPMYSLHQRIAARKNVDLKEINDLIRAASKDLEVEQIDQLELLLQRKERLKAVHTWPLDMSVVSRLLLYVIVPPLAWLGAAFVEIVLDSLLTAP